MLQLLQYVTSDLFVFIGCCVFVAVLGEALAKMIRALRTP